MQDKTNTLAKCSSSIGLNIHRGKSKVVQVNTANVTPKLVDDQALEEVNKFTYLGSMVDKHSGTETGVRSRIDKTRTAFHHLGLHKADLEHKIRMFNTTVKSYFTLRNRDMEDYCYHH
jgi:hypothetical protein